MIYFLKPSSLLILSNGCVMSRPSRCQRMRIPGTERDGKACESPTAFVMLSVMTPCRDSNPMLAETFEDPRMHFIAEKVCHNPVILAWHAEGEGWELYATSTGKTKFWGMYHPQCFAYTGVQPSFFY